MIKIRKCINFEMYEFCNEYDIVIRVLNAQDESSYVQ